jgi:hypothetical protein
MAMSVRCATHPPGYAIRHRIVLSVGLIWEEENTGKWTLPGRHPLIFRFSSAVLLAELALPRGREPSPRHPALIISPGPCASFSSFERRYSPPGSSMFDCILAKMRPLTKN